jgi:hypothetical protein
MAKDRLSEIEKAVEERDIEQQNSNISHILNSDSKVSETSKVKDDIMQILVDNRQPIKTNDRTIQAAVAEVVNDLAQPPKTNEDRRKEMIARSNPRRRYEGTQGITGL